MHVKIVMIKTTSYLYEGTVGELISMISSDTGEGQEAREIS